MRTVSMHEAERQAGSLLLTSRENGLTGYSSASFRVPTDAGKLTAFSRAISRWVNTAGSILIVEQTGVWPSSENMHLVETFRKAFGETRSIREAPVHLFSSDEDNDCCSMLSLCFFNFWDFTLMSWDRRILLRGSHDECVDIYTLADEDLKHFRELARGFGLKEVHLSTSSDSSAQRS